VGARRDVAGRRYRRGRRRPTAAVAPDDDAEHHREHGCRPEPQEGDEVRLHALAAKHNAGNVTGRAPPIPGSRSVAACPSARPRRLGALRHSPSYRSHDLPNRRPTSRPHCGQSTDRSNSPNTLQVHRAPRSTTPGSADTTSPISPLREPRFEVVVYTDPQVVCASRPKADPAERTEPRNAHRRGRRSFDRARVGSPKAGSAEPTEPRNAHRRGRRKRETSPEGASDCESFDRARVGSPTAGPTPIQLSGSGAG
jgi:hypothetical protein